MGAFIVGAWAAWALCGLVVLAGAISAWEDA